VEELNGRKSTSIKTRKRKITKIKGKQRKNSPNFGYDIIKERKKRR
jgi:hypothetical protein